MSCTTRLLFAASLLIAFAGGGCATRPAGEPLTGPVAAAPVRTEPWSFEGKPGKLLVTPHYLLFTTVDDDEVLGGVAQVLEGAYEQYRLLAPAVPPSDRPMECYLFGYRNEWASFTERNAGTDARVYLQISRGGYTVRDVFVFYFIGDGATASVAAHEGWHQFVSRHFKQRVPPFLEEGLACWFEAVQWDPSGRLPRWDLARNHNRLRGLREAIDDDRLIPLPQLVSMHAGQIVDQSYARIEGFYAQNWGFARFLWEGEGGRYRPALQRMLADAAAGKLYPPDEAGPDDAADESATTTWDPAAARPLLERYLGADLGVIDGEYRRFIRKIAFANHHPRMGMDGG